jgi:hypothetical protein
MLAQSALPRGLAALPFAARVALLQRAGAELALVAEERLPATQDPTMQEELPPLHQQQHHHHPPQQQQHWPRHPSPLHHAPAWRPSPQQLQPRQQQQQHPQKGAWDAAPARRGGAGQLRAADGKLGERRGGGRQARALLETLQGLDQR